MDAAAIRGYGPAVTPRQRRFALALLAPLLLARPLPGQEPARVPDSVVHRPSAVPDRIILTWAGDPARTQAVTWRSAPGGAPGGAQAGAQIAPLDQGLDFLRQARTVLATSVALETDLGPARYHTVRFEGLEPGARYVYRVGDGENWSPWAQFATAAARPQRFSFLYLGDEQNYIASLWSRVVRAAARAAPEARFIVHAGDLVDSASSDAQWGEWHAAAGWLNATVSSVPVAGNHDHLAAGDTAQRLSTHWRPQFALPEHGPAGLEETVYWFDYQGVRLVVLNSNERHEEQAAWLEPLLRENPNRWTIVTFHHPLFSAAGGRDYPQLREVWGRLFDRYRVDLVLQGHDHAYARGSLSPDPGGAPGAWITPGATMYVVSVSGPKMYRLRRESWMQRAAERTPLFQVITVDGDRLSFEARTATGELYDAFELHKQGGRPNRLVNRIPAGVPERVRPDSAAIRP